MDISAHHQAAIDYLADKLVSSRNVVFLTGAGMSTESGIPDFRSQNGLWKDKDLMDLASPHGMEHDFETFTEFYRWRIQGLQHCRPNAGHEILARWYRQGRITRLITQNVDGFHQEAGAPDVIELHGSIRSARCQTCGSTRSDAVYLAEGGHRCACGGKMRPNVVMFGEALPEAVLEAAARACEQAQLIVVLGSSLAVSPANRLPLLVKRLGGTFVILNQAETELDDEADALIRAPIGATLHRLDRLVPGT